jgi:hypothetical protein
MVYPWLFFRISLSIARVLGNRKKAAYGIQLQFCFSVLFPEASFL